MHDPRLIFEKDHPGRRIVRFPGEDTLPGIETLIPEDYLRADEAPLPEVGELDLVRHFTHLSKRNKGVNDSFYPLGSCTMKYNPLFNESASAQPGFTDLHPYQPTESVQGLLEAFFLTEKYLAEISGLPHVSLHPAAGAHGELTALLVIRKYIDSLGEDQRRTVLIPDSAHGTNPASCTFSGFKTREIKSSKKTGLIDVEGLKKAVGDDTAAIMVTNPNTLGLFEKDIEEICAVVHDAGGQVYMDGANLNAIMGVTRPGDAGVDVMHFNLHKTFSTPHGCGGPGSGPIGVVSHLEPFLPVPRVSKKGNGRYTLSADYPQSIGRTRSFFGNTTVIVRALCYILAVGADGIGDVARNAVINANYLRVKLGKIYPVPYDRTCMHEFVATPKGLGKARAIDVAKRLIDLGAHPPTVYFPLIVPEAIMIEPTETESVDTLDRFVDAMVQIAREAREDLELLLDAPHETPVGRPDEVRAVKEPVLIWSPR